MSNEPIFLVFLFLKSFGVLPLPLVQRSFFSPAGGGRRVTGASAGGEDRPLGVATGESEELQEEFQEQLSGATWSTVSFFFFFSEEKWWFLKILFWRR